MQRLLLLLLCLIPFVSHAADTRGLRVVAKDPATNQTAEVKLYNKSYAVVIGIDYYKNLSPDRQLKNAVKDASGVETTIRKQYRFDRIFTLHNEQATRDNIMRLLTAELPKVIGKDDALFIFWAGHGNQEKTDDGDLGYLIPYDGNSDGIYGNITMSQLKDDISRAIPAKHIFYAFDACYSGLLTTRGVDAKASRNLAYLKTITKERVRQVLTAGSKGQEALDGGPRGHSVFTGRLIEVLEATGDYITANEIQAILKERVYQDARARGHEQTPGFGALYGGGDFVFVPNVEQKVQDNRAELARIEAELRQLELQEAEARKYQTEQQQRVAEQRRKSAEARLKAEQLRQQQLQEEAIQQQKMLADKVRFDAEQSRREQELSTARKAEEQRMAALKAELAKKKQTVPASATGSITAAVAEIKRLNAEIEGVEAVFMRELEAGKNRIASRYDAEISSLRLVAKQKQKPLMRDEFETEAEYKARVAKQQSSYSDRIAELEQKKLQEIANLEKRLAQEQTIQTANLRASLQQLANRQFTVGAETVVVELGAYNPDQQIFPVSLRSKIQTVQIAMNGTIPLQPAAARSFKQQWQVGAIRPQVAVRAGSGEVVAANLVNDGDNTVYEYLNDEFMTVAERKQRKIERAELEQQVVGEMSFVPSGCFNIESTRVCLDAFNVGKHEVTQYQWRKLMGNNPSYFSRCGDSCPVEQVSWNDTQAFITRLNSLTGKQYRLPTEVEWEYVCRDGGTEKYCGSYNIRDIAWYDDNSGAQTHPVGQKQPNKLGVYDMIGNVWEWCQDWYSESWPSGAKNPTGTTSGFSRVNRGGGWSSADRFDMSAKRGRDGSDFRSRSLGFRIVAPAS